ncbi:hypothetical protein KR074_000412, partial [Drosophila pseudoananassae]
MNANELQSIIQGALAQQEDRPRAEFEAQINSVNVQLQNMRVETPQVEAYQRVSVQPGAPPCDIPLYIIKSVPDFNGEQDGYVAWRQSATDAYELFKPYQGSCAHYQAVTIIRNKIRGPARALLVSHNTVLNFDAILARLDCSYADKTSLRLLRLKSDQSLMQYYDEVERKLTLVTNKIVMSHDIERATLLNNEVRADALHVFISGLKKNLRAVVFPAQPKDLPSALALAREAEASIERSQFVATYARAMEQKTQNSDFRRTQFRTPDKQGNEKNPHYFKRPDKNQQNGSGRKPEDWADRGDPRQAAEPMDWNPSSSKSKQQHFKQNQYVSQPQNMQAKN